MTPLTGDPDTGTFGARVEGLALAGLDARGAEKVLDLLDAHGVLHLPDQLLSPEEQLAVGRLFGPLQRTDYGLRHPDHDEIIHVTDVRKEQRITERWHADSTYFADELTVCLLNAVEVPPSGGDTMFADQVRAHDGLSDRMKDLLAGLRAVHSGAAFARIMGADPADAPRRVHDVVRIHPRSGRRFLYVNAAYVDRFEGMTVEEGRGLLRTLFDYATTPDLVYRHRWAAGDVLIWDNRTCQHYAVHDYGSARRELWRVSALDDGSGTPAAPRPA